MIVINESGLYDMIFDSRLPKAKEFRHWLTSDVIPSIRKTGKYEVGQKQDSYQISDPIKLQRDGLKSNERNSYLNRKYSNNSLKLITLIL